MPRVSWTEEEIDLLRKAYREGLSLKDMGYFLKRSVTAVNKALYRFSVRKKENRVLPQKVLKGGERQEIMRLLRDASQKCEEYSSFATFENFEQKNRLKQEVFSESLDSQEYGSLAGYESDILQEQERGFYEGVSSNFLPSYDRFKKRIPYRHLERFVFFEDVLKWLDQRGFIIEQVQQDFLWGGQVQTPDALYKISSSFYAKEKINAFKTKAQLLLFANKVRLKDSLPLFYVFEVTSE